MKEKNFLKRPKTLTKCQKKTKLWTKKIPKVKSQIPNADVINIHLLCFISNAVKKRPVEIFQKIEGVA